MKKIILILAVLFCMVCFEGNALALGPYIDKHFAIWDQNVETDLAGYYLYWRPIGGAFTNTSRVQVLPTATAGGKTAPSFDLMGLVLASGKYEIAVSAYNTAANEGVLSNIVPFDGSYPGSVKNLRNER